VESDSALSLRHEEIFQGLLCRLLGHEAGVGVIATFLMTAGNPQIMRGLPEPPECCIMI
jgi:hypothetical protein